MAKTKLKVAYVCTECGADHPKWQGQCAVCGEWNVLSRVNVDPGVSLVEGFTGETSEMTKLNEVKSEELARMPTGIGELDRVLGGGFVCDWRGVAATGSAESQTVKFAIRALECSE